MAYSTPDQLLLGNIPLPPGNKARNAVDRAADEIDATLGFLYQTPIRSTGPHQRAVDALMGNLNNWLATGRLGLELTASTQRTEEHAYFLGLVKQATATLRRIVDGEIILQGVLAPGGEVPSVSGPMIYNKDDSSNVDDFYDQVTQPPEFPAQGFYLGEIIGYREFF